MKPIKIKENQGAYITLEAKKWIAVEAEKRNLRPTTLASDILERAAKRFEREDRKES